MTEIRFGNCFTNFTKNDRTWNKYFNGYLIPSLTFSPIRFMQNCYHRDYQKIHRLSWLIDACSSVSRSLPGKLSYRITSILLLNEIFQNKKYQSIHCNICGPGSMNLWNYFLKAYEMLINIYLLCYLYCLFLLRIPTLTFWPCDGRP